MANPNIVNVTSIYGESIGEALSTTATTAIMTVQTNGSLVKINYIQVANDHASTAIVVTVAISKLNFTSAGIGSGEDNAARIYLASTVNCPADDILVVLDNPIYLMEGDILEAGATPATADIFISYEVINDA